MDHRVAIELLGYWLGGGTASQLGGLLGVTREHAQRTFLRGFREEHPGKVTAERGRGFRLNGDDYSLRYAPNTVAGFLDLMRGLAAEADGQGADGLLGERFLATSLIADSGVKTEPMQGLMAACTHKYCVDIDYVGRRRLSRIRFSPHALIACAHRPHFRGFARGEDYERFIDIVPGRVRALQGMDHHDYIGPAEDAEWHERVDLLFEVNAALPEPVRNSIIEENGGLDRLLVRRVRRAVEIYIRREIEQRFAMDEIVHAWRLIERRQASNMQDDGVK